MKSNTFGLIILFIFCFSVSFGQVGGKGTYEFLNLTYSARIAALGGDFLAINDNDPGLAYTNPALINKDMHNSLAMNFIDYYSDIKYGSATYSRTFSKLGNFAFTALYMNYGSFVRADETGERTGEFTPGETAINIGWGRKLSESISIGANLKAIHSSLDTYTSNGIGVDVAGNYRKPQSDLNISLIAKNIGIQFKTYDSGNSEALPFELQAGLSNKLKHIPFTYSLLFNHLEKWDLKYDNPAERKIDPLTGEIIRQGDVEDFFDNLIRHIVIGGELNLHKAFCVRAGYNYQRRQELKVDSKVSTVGFSYGFGLKISKFSLNYSRSTYHLAGSPNYFSILINLSDFIKKTPES